MVLPSRCLPKTYNPEYSVMKIIGIKLGITAEVGHMYSDDPDPDGKVCCRRLNG